MQRDSPQFGNCSRPVTQGSTLGELEEEFAREVTRRFSLDDIAFLRTCPCQHDDALGSAQHRLVPTFHEDGETTNGAADDTVTFRVYRADDLWHAHRTDGGGIQIEDATTGEIRELHAALGRALAAVDARD